MSSRYRIKLCKTEDEWRRSIIELCGNSCVNLSFERLNIHMVWINRFRVIPLNLIAFDNENRVVSILQWLMKILDYSPLWRNVLIVSGGFHGSSLLFSSTLSTFDRYILLVKYLRFMRSFYPEKNLFTTNVVRFYVDTNDSDLICLLKMTGFELIKVQQTPMVDLTLGIDKLWRALNKKTRNEIRQGIKRGVHVYELTNWDGVKIYFRLKGKTISKRDREIFSKGLMTGVIRIFLANVDEKPVAAAAISINGDCIEYMMAAMQKEFQWYRPMNVLLWSIIEWGVKNGYRKLNLCGADPKGSSLYSITRFKLGFSTYMKDLYVFQRVSVGILDKDLESRILTDSIQHFFQRSNIFQRTIANLIR